MKTKGVGASATRQQAQRQIATRERLIFQLSGRLERVGNFRKRTLCLLRRSIIFSWQFAAVAHVVRNIVSQPVPIFWSSKTLKSEKKKKNQWTAATRTQLIQFLPFGLFQKTCYVKRFCKGVLFPVCITVCKIFWMTIKLHMRFFPNKVLIYFWTPLNWNVQHPFWVL